MKIYLNGHCHTLIQQKIEFSTNVQQYFTSNFKMDIRNNWITFLILDLNLHLQF